MSAEWASFTNNVLSIGGFTGATGLIRSLSYQSSRSIAHAAMSSFEVSACNLEGLAGKSFKPFTKSHYRDNLMELTGISPPGKTMHAHHVFTQKFEVEFIKKGINIHDPKYLTWWEAKPHLKTSQSYNNKWEKFFYENPEATPNQILEAGREIMNDYGIKTNY